MFAVWSVGSAQYHTPQCEAWQSRQAYCYILQDEETGLVALDIDLSVLSLPRAPLLAAKLLGPDWRASLSVHAIPADIARRRVLSLAEYKKLQRIAQD
jgi:hypothetical protein